MNDEKKEMGNYYPHMDALFMATDGKDIDADPRGFAEAIRPSVDTITSIVENIPIYAENQAKAEEFYQAIKTECEEKGMNKVKAMYIHLMNRIANSPTTIHMHGSIVLIMPLLKRSIDEYLEGGESK